MDVQNRLENRSNKREETDFSRKDLFEKWMRDNNSPKVNIETIDNDTISNIIRFLHNRYH